VRPRAERVAALARRLSAAAQVTIYAANHFARRGRNSQWRRLRSENLVSALRTCAIITNRFRLLLFLNLIQEENCLKKKMLFSSLRKITKF
jgi:hypothetical protein